MSRVCSKSVEAGSGRATYACCAAGKVNCGDGLCCDPDKCGGGKCRCPDGRPKCGSECCAKGKVCSKAVEAGSGKTSYACCAPGKINCGDGKCCDKPSRCCGGKCCSEGTVCASSATAGIKGKVCCPPTRVATKGGRVCCPIGTVASGSDCCPAANPDCCGDELVPLCLKGQICVRGVCQPVG